MDDRYKEISDISTLKEIECKAEIQVFHRETNLEGNVIIVNDNGRHKKGLDGFDPDCRIEGLEHALKNITFEKSKIIWELLKKHYKRISGVVESAGQQDYSNSKKEEKFSLMGELLFNNPWLPDAAGNFHKPSDILLSTLFEEFDRESIEAKFIADKLKFKTSSEQELLNKLPEEKKKGYELVNRLYQSMRDEEKANVLLERLVEQNTVKSNDLSAQEVITKFEDSLVRTKISPTNDGSQDQEGSWSGQTPENEEQIRKEYGNKFPERSKRMKLTGKTKITTDYTIIGGIDSKEFLFEQYHGHCQICNTRLDVGENKKPYFEVFRLDEIRGKNAWANMEFNVLCLCPNCHALLENGSKDLRNVLEVANMVLNNDVAPEPIDERRGDFYIVKIKMIGEERELFYSPTHMNKLAAFIEQSSGKE